MNYELWIPTSIVELKKAWSSTLAHFSSSEVGRYCIENKIKVTVTDEREPRPSFLTKFYYKVSMPDLADEHVMWFKLKGCLICREGMKATLAFPRETIRFVPQNSPTNFFYKPKSPPLK